MIYRADRTYINCLINIHYCSKGFIICNYQVFSAAEMKALLDYYSKYESEKDFPEASRFFNDNMAGYENRSVSSFDDQMEVSSDGEHEDYKIEMNTPEFNSIDNLNWDDLEMPNLSDLTDEEISSILSNTDLS